MLNARQIAFSILQDIIFKGSYADIALNRGLEKTQPNQQDRALVTELVYGVVRRQRTLDAIIDQFAKKKSHQQVPDILLVLRLGIYQLGYMSAIPESAAVNTSVELIKQTKYSQLSGLVNAILRAYIRSKDLFDPSNQSLGIRYSFPDWLIEFFLEQFGQLETEQLCKWFNQIPSLDIRINPLKTSRLEMQQILEKEGISSQVLPQTEQGLRLIGTHGSIINLPGYQEGLWSVQDASSQQVAHFLDPQPGDVIIDACAAPGGKTTHIAELLNNQGQILAIDPKASRLRKLSENAKRLELENIKIMEGDSRLLDQFNNSCDRLLLDVPCSGLGTLHRNLDLRWRISPEKIEQLLKLQKEIFYTCQQWVKPNGIIVYSTCTLNPRENQSMIDNFLKDHSNYSLVESIQLYPQRDDSDGFFMAKLRKS